MWACVYDPIYYRRAIRVLFNPDISRQYLEPRNERETWTTRFAGKLVEMLPWRTHGHPEWSLRTIRPESQLDIWGCHFCSLFCLENITVALVILLFWETGSRIALKCWVLFLPFRADLKIEIIDAKWSCILYFILSVTHSHPTHPLIHKCLHSFPTVINVESEL